jgi:hypothetical protein
VGRNEIIGVRPVSVHPGSAPGTSIQMSATNRKFTTTDVGPTSTRAADGRTTFATIVQSSTVELFQSFSIAVAPVAIAKGLPTGLDRQVSAAATLSSTPISGVLALFIPDSFCSNAMRAVERNYEPRDWTREVCNQLAGRIKNRLHGCNVELVTGLPTSVAGTLLERHRSGKPPEFVYGFRALRGEVTVTITGQIDFSRIVYSGNRGAAVEGDVILF